MTTTKTPPTKPQVVTYTCRSECKPSGNPNLGRGESVTLKADGTDVFLWFVDKSPFKRAGGQRIELQDGEQVTLTVHEETPDGDYPYLLDCRGCGISRGNPKMIVP